MSQIKYIRSGDLLEVYKYDSPFREFSELFAWSYTRPDEEKTSVDRFRASVTRTKNRVRRLIACNVNAWGQPPILVTLTFAENLTDLSKANKLFRLYTQRLHKYLKKEGYKNAKYVSIVEFQKRGAVHYHVIYFNLPFIEGIKDLFSELWGHGFVQLKAVKIIRNMSAYLTKYLEKGLTDKRLMGKKAYSCSKGLFKPIIHVVEGEDETYPLDSLFGSIKLERIKVEQHYQVGGFGSIKYSAYSIKK